MVKYQIFISSTYEDLIPEREQVIKAVLEMGHIPVGMEMFSAADEQQWEIIKRQIDQSDYYVVLIAHRYGSMDGDISFTEKEYDYAMSKKIPILGFVMDTSVEWEQKWIENNNDIKKRLDTFRSKISGKMVSFWKTPDDLYGKCGISLMKAFAAYPREGWVRSSQAKTTEMTSEITRLSRENGELRALINASNEAQIENYEYKVNQIIDALRLNVRKIHIWDEENRAWSEAIDTNLLEIFEAVAPDLLDETDNKTFADSLGFHFGAMRNNYNRWPVPSNFVKAYLADYVSLDLMRTSTKRHPVSDTQAYWTLTDFGREVYSKIRRNELLKGLADFDDVPEDTSTM